MSLTAAAEVELAEAATYLDPICEHLSEHGGVVDRCGDGATILFGPASATMLVRPGRLTLRAEAPDLPTLLSLRASLASHLREFAGSAAGPFRWTGDGADVVEPVEFRRMEVVAIEDVTPRMRRVVLSGRDLGRFATSQHLHCKLLFPPEGSKPVWPRLGSDGLIHWPQGPDALRVRKYTIRRVDPARGRMVIDFVRHADAGLGSAFAEAARVGDELRLIGPGGLGARPARWTLLAGDETALPAIARILEEMPQHALGLAVIAVEDADEIQALDAPPGVEVRWLIRRGSAANGTCPLPDAVKAVQLDGNRVDTLVWVGCEFASFREIRRHLRKTICMPTNQQHVVAYWRRG